MNLFKGLLKPMKILVIFCFAVIFWQIIPVKITKAADTIVDAKFVDADNNGTVDRIRWNMDESVIGCVYDAGDWTVNEIGSIGITITGLACGTGVNGRDATDLDILVTADEHETSSATLPQISYSNADVDNSVMLAGAMGTHSNVDATDGAAPQVYAVEYLDLYVNNGKVSWLSVILTELIDDDHSFLSENDLTITNPGSFTGLQFSTSTIDMLSHGGMSGFTFGINESSVLTTRETTGNFAMLARNNFYLQDPSGNVNSTLGPLTFDLIDGTPPVIKTFTYKDADSDGKIDSGTIVFSETVDFSESELAIRDIAVTVGDFTGLAAGNITTDLLVDGGPDSDTVNLTFDTEATAIKTYSSTFALTTDSDEALELVDLASPVNTNDSSLGAGITYLDSAAPVVVSVSPTDTVTDIIRTSDIAITFSEPMATTFVEDTQFDVTADPGDFTVVWSATNSVATLSHVVPFLCTSTVVVTTAEATINAANGSSTVLLTTGPSDGDWSFITRGCSSNNSSSGASTATSTTPVVTLTAPTGGSSLIGGDVQNVTWTTSGSGIDTIGIYYSADNGATYNQVAYNLNKSLETYAWTLPNLDSETVLVKIIAYDSGKGNLDTDVSTNFSITTVSEEIVSEEPVPEEENSEEEIFTGVDDEGRTVGTDSGLTGFSPVTGEEENISKVLPGQFVRSYSLPTIYYIGEDFVRYPFPDSNTFFTYADSFDEVVWVTDATLPTMTLGAPMLPMASVVLVKIQADPKTFTIDSGGMLRWLPSEAMAATLYGANWADYVIDLEPTFFAKFSIGDDMTSEDIVDLYLMKTRVELATATR